MPLSPKPLKPILEESRAAGLDACVEDVDGENDESHSESSDVSPKLPKHKYQIPRKLTNFFNLKGGESNVSQVASSMDSIAIEIPEERFV